MYQSSAQGMERLQEKAFFSLAIANVRIVYFQEL
jgi:hypothetical protein